MNTTIFYFFYNLSHQSYTFDQIAIFIANKLDMIVLFAAVVYLFYFFASHHMWQQKKLSYWILECITIGSSVVSAYIVSYILKIVAHAPRPFVTHVNVHPLISETAYSSFPSGHATLFFALATAIYLYNKKAGSIFFVVALLIALSRMVVGVHYPIDLLAGAIIGVVVAYLFHKFVNSIFSRKNL